MITYFDTILDKISIHHIGNKLLGEYYGLLDRPLDIEDELLGNLLTQFFLKPFEKVNEVYRFYHHNDNLAMNEIYHFAKRYFSIREPYTKIRRNDQTSLRNIQSYKD